MRLPQVRKGVIGIYSIQEKAEMTLGESSYMARRL